MPKTGRYTTIIKVPVTGGGTAIVDGAMLMPGVTQATNMGLAILGDAASAQAIGWLKGAHAVAKDSTQTGTIWTFRDVELIRPAQLVEWECSQVAADTIGITSVSGTTVTPAGTEENGGDTSWYYAVSGTGAKLLSFNTAVNGGTATSRTATGWDSTTKIIKIPRIFMRTLLLNTAKTKIKSQAAVGALTVDVMETYIVDNKAGITKQQLDPTKHDNLTLINPTFSVRVLHRVTVGV